MRRWLLAVVVVLLVLAIATAGVLMVREQQREAAAQVEADRRHAVAAAITQAQREIVPAIAAHDDVQLHFVRMGFYINTQTPDEEAAPLLSALEDGRTRVAAARKLVEAAPSSEAVGLYLQGLEELDGALESFAKFVPVGTALGHEYERESRDISAQRDIGSTGYARSEESMRAALKSNADRTRGVELIALAREHLAQADSLARSNETP